MQPANELERMAERASEMMNANYEYIVHAVRNVCERAWIRINCMIIAIQVIM